MSQSQRSIKCDVLIVGAGPAGAAAARYLVEKGYQVTILEKKKLPRYKICSGLLIDRSLDLLEEHFGTVPEKVFCSDRYLDGIRICSAEDSLIDAPLEKPRIYNVWRSEFDYWLVKKSGAEILDEHELLRLEETRDRIRVHVFRRRRETIEIEASWLIGADGSNSRVRKLANPHFDDQIRWFIPNQLYCSGTVNLEKGFFYAFLNPALSSFYAWLNFKDDYLIYGVASPKGERAGPYISNFTEYLKKYFQLRINEVKRTTGCLSTDMGITGTFCLGRHRVLLAGEAAGFMNMLGEGISSALATGRVAAEAVHQADSVQRDVLSIYESLVESEMELTRNSWKMGKTMLGRDFLQR